MRLYNKKQIDNYIEQLLKLNWNKYSLYLIGGALHKNKTKDIDVCIVGPHDSKAIFELMENSMKLGPFDLYFCDYDQINKPKPYMAKSRDRGHSKAKQRKGEWIDELFWQHLDFSSKNFNLKPLLIHRGSGS